MMDYEILNEESINYWLTSPEKKNWNDKHFLEHFAPKTRVKPIRMDIRKMAALNLINYFNERLNGYCPVTDVKILIYGMLSPSEACTEMFNFIFDDDSESCLISSQHPPNSTNTFDRTSEFPNDVNGFWRKAYSEIEQLTDNDLKNMKRNLGLMYLSAISYICITLFQMGAGNVKRMSHYMRTSMYKSFQNVYKPPRGFMPIPSLSEKMLSRIECLFKNASGQILEAFGLIVTGLIYYRSTSNTIVDHQEKITVLMKGCLDHLMYNGMHIVKLFVQLKRKTNLEQTHLKNLLSSKGTIKPLEKIMELYNENSVEYIIEHDYLPPMVVKNQITWKWARCFNERYYASFSGNDGGNLSLCTKLAAILLKYPEYVGIENMMIFRSPMAKTFLQGQSEFADKFFKAYGCNK